LNDDIKAWANAANAIDSAHRMEMCMMSLMVIVMIVQTGIVVWFEMGGRNQVIQEIHAVPANMIQHVRVQQADGMLERETKRILKGGDDGL
jgi:hypothetical protein